MWTSFLDWLDHRTGYRHVMDEALYENIPGGARWRYVTGSMLTFAFATQVITGFFLWMFYSPSSQTAWESVYFIQHEVVGGWLVRGIHHFMASAMIVLLGLHLLQVVWDGAYRAPREMNFWLGLVLMGLVLGMALTGYLLPWDQKGYWATNVATNLATLAPAGESVQKLAVGGDQYGHLTLTRFFALHAGILPSALSVILVLHLLLFRKHGITTHPAPGDTDDKFWPKQVYYDAVGCLVVLALVVGAAWLPGWLQHPKEPGHWGAELGAPADASEAFGAARPEWYFLFLFQLLKFFEGGLDIIGAIIIPGAIAGILVLMPIIGYSDWGHRFNQAFIVVVLLGAGALTMQAMYQDNYAALVDAGRVSGPAEDDHHGQLALNRSREYIDGVADAKFEAQRFTELAHEHGIPKTGAKELGLTDPVIRGRRLFKTNCAACHSYLDENGVGIRAKDQSAPNLYGFASRGWLTKLLDTKHFSSDEYFGKTKHRAGDMATFVKDDLPKTKKSKDSDGSHLEALIIALSAEAKRGDQKELDEKARSNGTIAKGKAAFALYECTNCHKYGDEGDENGPTLTGYGSQEWVVGMISDPDRAGFYPKNDRMPSFAKGSDIAQHQISKADIGLIAMWLRADFSGKHAAPVEVEPELPMIEFPEPPGAVPEVKKPDEKKDEKKPEEVKPKDKKAEDKKSIEGATK